MPLLTLSGVRKRFGGVQALKGVSFELEPGEVHALIGENGASKSTLIKTLSGVYEPDVGDMQLGGESVRFGSPRQAQAALILILDEPTQGVDVSAKAEIHKLMDALVAEGLGILMISSELLDVLGMADRILVMCEGRIVRSFPRHPSQEEVMRAATGGGASGVGADVPA